MLDQSRLLEDFRQSRALLEGHFQLSSGLHSPNYFQCALLFEDPQRGRAIGQALAQKLREATLGPIARVIGPAMGGIVVAYEVAAALGVQSAFAERDADGKMTLRRGFRVAKGERVVVCEDVITTGGSALEVARMLAEAGARPLAVACIVDRSAGAQLDLPVVSLMQARVETWTAEACPQCARGERVTKPGTRPDRSVDEIDHDAARQQ